MQKLILNPVKPAHWPTPWLACWHESQKPAASPLDDGGRASTWLPPTLRNVEQGVGLYLAYLQSQGVFDPEKPLVAYVDKARVQAFLDLYAPCRADGTVAGALRGIAYYLRATVPPDGLPWLTKLAHRRANSAKPARPKPPRMASAAALLELGFRLMEAGLDEMAQDEREGAELFRNGLMIAALIARPTLRLKNFSSLRLGHTFFKVHAGYQARIPRSQTKKKNYIIFRYPPWLTEPFELYLDEIRPKLPWRSLEDDEGWLWIGRKGAHALRPTSVTSVISGTTQLHLGRAVSPHLFRDCGATDIALLAPEDVGITKDVLGHKTLASSQKFYNQACSFKALAELERVLLGLMDG